MVLQMDPSEKERDHDHTLVTWHLSDIIDVEHTSYEEATEKKEWKDAMVEEY